MKKQTTKKSIWPLARKIVFWAVGISFGIILLGLGVAVLDVNISIRNVCKNAQAKYSTTCSQSLIKLIENPNESFHDKNDAIWTLGRMRSTDAYSALQKIYTGIIPDREPYDGMISQYEIRKALLRIDEKADVSPKVEKTLKEKFMDCLPKSDVGSKKICDDLVKTITTFSECADAGFPILESYPPQCSTPDGRHFIGPKQ